MKTQIKERPILFSAPMVRAILDVTKTQTRRIVKIPCPLNGKGYYSTGKVLSDLTNQPGAFMEFRGQHQDAEGYEGSQASFLLPCPYGKPGDRLWVRETFGSASTCKPSEIAIGSPIVYFATPPAGLVTAKKWPSIFMMRWMSRILLEVVSVRVERLQDISEEDAIAEGVCCHPKRTDLWQAYNCKDGVCTTARKSYETLWMEINGPDSWDANPFVWVVEFKHLTK